jgi:hypothetical protein
MQSTYDPTKRKLLSVLSHAAIFFSVGLFSVGLPVGVYLLSDDPVAKGNAKESINFHFNVWFWATVLGSIFGFLGWISFGLLWLILWPVVVLGFLLHWGLTIWAISHCLTVPDEPFRYPFIFRLL